MAYPALHWQQRGAHVGFQPIAEASLTQQLPLGTLTSAVDATYGEGTFVYLQGVASTAPGDVVAYDGGAGTTTRALQGTTVAGPLAVAASACTAGLYGWYQVGGACPAKANNTAAGNASLGSTAGRLEASGANTALNGIVLEAAASGGYATVQLASPSIAPPPSATYSLRDEGALGDGSDDSAAFVAAEAKAYAAGGAVYVPPGTFTALNLSTRVSVVGTGTLKLKAQAPTLPQDALPLLTTSASDITISGVTFDGNSSSQSLLLQDSNNGATRAALIHLGSVSRITIQGCHFQNSLHACVSNTSTYNSEVSTADFNGVTVIGCTFRDSISRAIEMFGVAPADGVATMTSGGLQVVGNYFENMGGLNPDQTPPDTHMYGDTITFGWLRSANIIGNVFQTCKRAAMKGGVVLNCSVRGNVFRDTFWNAVQFQPAAPGSTAVDYDGTLSICSNDFSGCAYADANNLNVGGAILLNGTAGNVNWTSGVLSISGNTITHCPDSTSASRAHDAIYVQASSHFRVNHIQGNVIRHVGRHGIHVELADTAFKETAVIQGNTVDLTGYGTTAACVFVDSAASMTSANRLKQLDISGNTCIAGTHGIWLQYDPARNITLQDNKLRAMVSEPIYWAEASTPLTCFIDGNQVTEYTPQVFVTVAAANVLLGNNNRCSSAGAFVNIAGTVPTGFLRAASAPTSGYWRLADPPILNTSPTSGGYVGWVCTTAGWANNTAWANTHAYALGAFVNNDSGKAYVCTVAGTSAGSGGPTGTGTGITDGTVTWNYVAPLAVFKTFGAIS